MAVTVMYMGPPRGDVDLKIEAWRYFLEEVLKPAGVERFTTLRHNLVRWDNSVVFFDRAGAPGSWVKKIIAHLLDQGNVVVVVFDPGEEHLVPVSPFTRERQLRYLLRTWEANEVRAVFQEACNLHVGLIIAAAEAKRPLDPNDPTAEHVRAH
jgi:hypothetical protein